MQRSACVVAALLVRHQMPLYKAIEFIQKRRKIAFTPQVNFIDSLLLYTVNNQ
jgi:protein-tyrosine phosphatase